jgi:hypothetical protein
MSRQNPHGCLGVIFTLASGSTTILLVLLWLGVGVPQWVGLTWLAVFALLFALAALADWSGPDRQPQQPGEGKKAPPA